MTYGASKERDMLRSVLPSTARKGARENKRAANQRNRSRVRQALRVSRDALAHEGDTQIVRERDHSSYDGHYVEYDLCDLDWDFDAPYVEIYEADRDYNRDIRDAMWDRRNYDKTRPLERWAVAQTEGVRKRDRLSGFQARFPDNLITRHAMSHVGYLDEFDLRDRYYYLGGGARLGASAQWLAAARYAHAVDMLYKVCTGPLKRFNESHTRTHLKNVRLKSENPEEFLPGGWRLVEIKEIYCPGYWGGVNAIRGSRTRLEAVYSLDVDPLMGIHDIHDYIVRMSKVPSYGDRWTTFEARLVNTFANYKPIDTLDYRGASVRSVLRRMGIG